MIDAVLSARVADGRRWQAQLLRAGFAANIAERRRGRLLVILIEAILAGLIAVQTWQICVPLLGTVAGEVASRLGVAVPMVVAVLALILARLAYSTRREVDEARIFGLERRLARFEAQLPLE